MIDNKKKSGTAALRQSENYVLPVFHQFHKKCSITTKVALKLRTLQCSTQNFLQIRVFKQTSPVDNFWKTSTTMKENKKEGKNGNENNKHTKKCNGLEEKRK